MEDLTGEEEFGEDASQQSSALQEGDTVCFKMAHGEIVTRVGKMTFGVVAENVPQNAAYGSCILQDETIFTCSIAQLWVAKHRMDDENIRMKCPKSKLKLVVSSLNSEPKKLKYDIQLSEQEYKFENDLRSPTGSDTVHKREDVFSEEDDNDEDPVEDEGPPDYSNEDTAKTLLAMTTATRPKRERSLSPNPTHLQRMAGSGTGSVALSNFAGDDPVVANLKQEMLEMKTTMQMLLQGGVDTGKKQTPKNARRTKDKGDIPKDEKARCALLKGKDIVEDNGFAFDDDDDDEDFVSEEEAAQRGAQKATLERLQKKRSTLLRNWKDGKARNCDPNKVWDDIHEATALDLPEAFQKMEKLGYAVIVDYTKLRKNQTSSDQGDYGCVFEQENLPTYEQSTYYATSNNVSKAVPKMETIFEGVKVNQSNIDFIPVKPMVARDGTELRQVMKYGTASYKAYQKKYNGQAEDIIKGMFQNHTKKSGRNPASDPKNWSVEQNIVVGAQDHQHPHCDQGKVGSYASELIFPFVAVHGFGVNEFQLWLLPCHRRRDHGFLYQFPKTAIVFMRGDFVHAGGCLQEPRAHMEFFPQAEAGWDDENPYWAPNRMEGWMKDKTIFLIPDLRCAPFAYPALSKRAPSGDQTATYPADLTDYLIVPVKRDKPVKKRKRKSKDGNTPGEDDMENEDEVQPATVMAQTRKIAKMLNNRKW